MIKSEYFVGYEFKKYLLPVQQAIVCYLLKDDNYTEKFLDVGDAKIRLINEMELITGFKYLKRGALKKVVKDVVFEIEFHSSHWNFYGQSIEVTADLRVIYKPYYKKYGKYPSDNIVAVMGYHPENAYWYDITTEEKLLEVSKILGQQLKETAVDLVNKFEDDYEDAIKYLIGEGYEKYHVYLDFVADTLGQDIIKDRVKEICDGLSDENKEEIVRYRNGARDKAWMLNRCDLRYIVDNNLV